MANMDIIENAAGAWLQRLHGQTKLPPSGTLEMLRRREVSARKSAEDLAEAERRCATLAQERLLDERRLGSWREESLMEAQRALEAERRLRLNAEAALAQSIQEKQRAEDELSAQKRFCEAVERGKEAAKQEIVELRAILEDDTSLRVLDDFTNKLEVQRSEIAMLRECLGMEKQEAGATLKALQTVRAEFARAQKEWSLERETMLQERKKIAHECELLRHECSLLKAENQLLKVENQHVTVEMEQLQVAGDSLQAVAEATLAACTAPVSAEGREPHVTMADSAAANRTAEAASSCIAEEDLLLAMLGVANDGQDESTWPWLLGGGHVHAIQSEILETGLGTPCGNPGLISWGNL